MTDTTEPQTVEERVARHLAARDWLTTEDRWDNATSSFRANYLSDAREVIALVQAAVVPAADRAALRDRIADALYVHDHPGWRVPLREADVEPVYQERAAAILSVLPAPADRAAVLEEAADKLAEFIALHGPTSRTVAGWTGAEAFLRRMAVESAVVDRVAAETEAHPAEHTWAAELHDPLADEWVPGTRYTDRDRAVNALTHAKRLGPTWKDGTPTERRLVRATTTYTVEEPDGPVVEAQPGKDTETPEVVAYSDR
ncbi:hypothetical protein PV755_46535 [Streptomyces caniscabiei]|uniref:Uncharacterized protein n=1 Tax=Streptomyces caniscabiei TaxID=2746961 RepID=A0A927KZY7_9ACTN|nr:hypothetical protein [Streptomyces caniscabiei]MBD9723481.1 hypothetical protein [Streptomyces caniscabiei]MDX3516263.1 hypothetical protein [Streptomyces caniscabiei]WEO27051.1 hypothetical protein IHE65_29990 [Streptomyces caniscabiei]